MIRQKLWQNDLFIRVGITRSKVIGYTLHFKAGWSSQKGSPHEWPDLRQSLTHARCSSKFYLCSVAEENWWQLKQTSKKGKARVGREEHTSRAHWVLALAIEVRQSGARGWGTIMPAEIRQCSLRFGARNWPALPIEIRQCPLRSGARGWGPAVPTDIWSSQLRKGNGRRRNRREGGWTQF